MPQNALQEYARTAALQQQTAASAQEMQQRQQLAPGALQQQSQQTQAQQMQIDQQKLDLQDAQNAHKLGPQFLQKDDSGKITGFDNEGYYNALIGTGMNPAKVNQLRMQNVTYQQNLQKLGKDQLDLQNEKNDNAYQIIEPLRQAANDPKADVAHVNSTWQAVVPKLLALGLRPQDIPASFQTPQEAAGKIQDFENELGQHKQMLADAKTGAETAQNAAKAVSETKQAIPELGIVLDKATGQTTPLQGANGMMTPAMMESKYVALAQKKDQGQALSPDDQSWMKGYEKYKALVPTANFNLQNSGAAADAGGNPSQIAQALADNRMKWSEAVSPRTPQSVKNAIMAQVFKLNPNFDTSEFGLEADSAKKARSGAWSDTRLGYNTALDHADQLLSAADALKNGDTQKLNQLKNYFSTQFGSPDVTNFQAIANAYNHEVTSVVSKGHITDAEVAQGHATLPDNASPEQIRGVVNAYKNLMTSKRDELDKIIKAGAGSKANAMLNTQSGGGKPNPTQPGAFSWDAMPKHTP